MIYPEHFEEKIGFDKIRKQIIAHCLSSMGIDHVHQMNFQSAIDEIVSSLKSTNEFLQILANDDPFPIDNYIDLRPVLAKTSIEGSYMEVQELVNFRDSLETIRSIVKFFDRGPDVRYPELKALAKRIRIYPYLFDAVHKILSPKGEIKDKASLELAKIRNELRDKEKQVHGKLNQILKSARRSGIVDENTQLTVRNGRLVIPLNVNDKRKIKGLIHDESATGKTVFLEPAEIVELNNGIRELEYAEKREVIKVLREFSGNLQPYMEELVLAYNFLGMIDFIRAKALFSRQVNGVMPAIVAGPVLDWKNALHPLLFLNFKAEKKTVVPLTIRLTQDNRILVISGPNAGGKSVCLQTVGLLQYMVQSGLLVPMAENSEVGIFESIYLDMGDDQSLENDLSTYSSHLNSMKVFCRHASERSLVLIDEFGTGTEPQLGGAIAESVLNQLLQTGTYGVVTTHYTNLKHHAASAEGLENGAMLFDNHKMQPLFQLEIGKPGSSFAFEIARKIGIPEHILKDASEKVGKDHVEFDKHLKDIVRDKRYWERKRNEIRQAEKRLVETLEKYRKELEILDREKNEIVESAKGEAKAILDGTNQKIENTIRVIKESQADRELTRKVRKELEEFRAEVQERAGSHNSGGDKLQQIEKEESRLGKIVPPEKSTGKKSAKEAYDGFRKGDLVKMKGQDTIGEIMEIQGKSILVSFGNLITSLEETKLVHATPEEIKRTGRSDKVPGRGGFDIFSKQVNFKPEIDIRGKRAEEALQIVQEFIDDAIMVNASRVKILHGKGDGVLRNAIREYLNTIDLVTSAKDEHVEMGGSGITVVELGE